MGVFIFSLATASSNCRAGTVRGERSRVYTERSARLVACLHSFTEYPTINGNTITLLSVVQSAFREGRIEINEKEAIYSHANSEVRRIASEIMAGDFLRKPIDLQKTKVAQLQTLLSDPVLAGRIEYDPRELARKAIRGLEDHGVDVRSRVLEIHESAQKLAEAVMSGGPLNFGSREYRYPNGGVDGILDEHATRIQVMAELAKRDIVGQMLKRDFYVRPGDGVEQVRDQISGVTDQQYAVEHRYGDKASILKVRPIGLFSSPVEAQRAIADDHKVNANGHSGSPVNYAVTTDAVLGHVATGSNYLAMPQ